MKVSITQHYIDMGYRRDGSRCPIACALMDMGYPVVDVDGSTAYYVEPNDESHVAQLPDEARDFVRMYDADQPVTPFEFELVER